AQKIVGLEDETDVLTDIHEGVAPGSVQFLPEYTHAAMFDRAKRAREREHRGFTGTRWSGDNNDFTRQDVATDIEQNLFSQRAGAIEVADVAHRYDWCFHSPPLRG